MIQKAAQISENNHNHDGDVSDFIYDLFRDKRILRWTSGEILNGYKIIRGKRYFLEEALNDKSLVKIDMISNINHSFIEVTNITTIIYKKDNEHIPIGLEPIHVLNPNEIFGAVEDTYFSNKYYSPLKCCKRMYSLASHFHDSDLIQRLIPILSGDTSALGKLDLKLLLLLLFWKIVNLNQ